MTYTEVEVVERGRYEGQDEVRVGRSQIFEPKDALICELLVFC